MSLYKKEEINKRDPNSENLCQSSWKSNSCKTILTFLNAKHISKKWNEKLYSYTYSVTLKTFRERFQLPRRWQLADSTCGLPDTSNGTILWKPTTHEFVFHYLHIFYLWHILLFVKVEYLKIRYLISSSMSNIKSSNFWFKKINN